jgi:hypothetical protein
MLSQIRSGLFRFLQVRKSYVRINLVRTIQAWFPGKDILGQFRPGYFMLLRISSCHVRLGHVRKAYVRLRYVKSG